MKYLPNWLFLLLVLAIGFVGFSGGQTSRLTSGFPTPHLPPRGIFVPPNDSIIIEFRTNHVPLVVETTVTSNVIRRSIWFHQGQAQTNDLLLTNSVILKTTNAP